MSEHTAGPWHVVDLSNSTLHPILSIETDAPAQICEIDLAGLMPMAITKAKADASLLAAAPDLLEALKLAVAHLDYCGYGDKWERECAVESGLEKRLEAAIAKAEAE
jgi:hypothetical protein